MLIYQAGPLFTDAEKDFHKKLSSELTKAGHSVVWPGALLTDEQISAAGNQGGKLIFNSCKDNLDRCDCLVALLDGTQVDDGTSWEIGYAYAKNMPVYGLRTDARRAGDAQDSPVNSMIAQCLTGYATNVGDLLAQLAQLSKPERKAAK